MGSGARGGALRTAFCLGAPKQSATGVRFGCALVCAGWLPACAGLKQLGPSSSFQSRSWQAAAVWTPARGRAVGKSNSKKDGAA